MLSRGGKEVLLKSVIQAMPAYAMSLFKFTDTFYNEIEVLMSKFWWGKLDRNQGISWMSWKRLSRPKSEGGMGFRSLREFNDALLAKQGWRLMTSQTSLVYSTFKAKYFPYIDFLHATQGSNPRYLWTSIHSTRELLISGCRRRIGNGVETLIWEDKWLADCPYNIQCDRHDGCILMWVAQLWDLDTHNWDRNKLDQCFPPQIADKIEGIPLPQRYEVDSWVWHPDRSGQYSVRSGYHHARSSLASTNNLPSIPPS